jgi:8-oxo-dGTP pyrophosphatase MutT (NUDIX family)
MDMKLLATFKAKDVDLDAPDFDYASFKPRSAIRAIVFDGDKVALIYVKEHGYYMLPGGGLENNEDVHAGLSREIVEELGCEIVITGEVGCIEVYFDRWSQRQTDYCYTSNKMGETTEKSLTDFEIKEGHDVVWVEDIQTAIKLVANVHPKNLDGKLVQARDLLFLKSVEKLDR